MKRIFSLLLVATILITCCSCSIKVRVKENEEIPSGEQMVPEEIAQLFGVDPNEYDSDDDGLSNYVEIYMSGTDPTLADTDCDGISDADEDADEDGLTNAQELNIGTDLAKVDSDGDGISDYVEFSELKTDPCKYDTDEDALSDGDEVVLGLNPLEKKTDGVTLDSERKFTQELAVENFDEQLTAVDNDAIPSLTLTTSGNVNNRVVVTTTGSNDFGDSRAVIGEPIDILGEDIGEGTISFALKDADSTDFVEDTDVGFNTKLVCKYNDNGTTSYLNTTYDAKKNTVSAAVDDAGTYFVLDVKNLFDELGLAMPRLSEMSVLSAEVSATAASVEITGTRASTEVEKVISRASTGAMAQADIVFLIDTTGSMSAEINNVKENVEYFIDALKEKGVSAGLALIDYQDINADGYDSTRVHKNGTSNWFYDMDAYKNAISALDLGYGGDTPECAVDALETGRLLDMRASAGKIFILVTDATYKVANRYGIPSMEAEIELLKNAGITCAVVSTSSDQGAYYDLYNETNGVWANIYGDFYTELMLLADKIGSEIVGDGYWIYLDGPVPVPVRLDEEPTEGSTADTDKDGIYDIEELEGVTPTGSIDLDALLTEVSHGIITGTDYGTVMMYKYKSSPVDADTDFDGIEDKKDDMPRSNTFKGVLSNSFDEGINVSFTMDYRILIDNSNTQYSSQKSTLACVLAMLAYGAEIEINSGANVDGKAREMYAALGLQNFADYSMKDMPAIYQDDDLSEILIGHRLVTYQGQDTEVFIVAVRGTNGTVEEWSSNFDVGSKDEAYWDYDNPEWTNELHHKGFDVTANRCYELIQEYIDTGITTGEISATANKSIFITGHSRGAAISNLLGKMFEDRSDFKSSVYGFATPNTTTASNAADYRTIFNVVNKDDIVPYLPLEEWGFTKYGITKAVSVKEKYENKWFGAQEGTWENLINANRKDKLDYNYNGHKQATLKEFAKVAPTIRTATTNEIRKSLYVKPYTDDSYLLLDKTYSTEEEARAAIPNIKEGYGKRLARACEIRVRETTEGIFDKKTVYKIYVAQSPEFLMMTVAALAGGDSPSDDDLAADIVGFTVDMLGYKVAPLYNKAKREFIHSAIDSAGKEGTIHNGWVRFGGMTHGHWPETYYLLATYMN